MDFQFKQKVLLAFSFLIGLVIFILLGKIIGWEKIIGSLSIFTGWQGLVILLFSLLIVIVGNWRWKEVLKDYGENVNFWTLFKIYLGGYAMMYLFPILLWGGEGFRVFGLTRKSKVPWKKAFTAVFIERVLEWTANLLVIFAGMLFFLYNVYVPPVEIILLFGIFLFLFVVIIGYFYIKALRKKSIVLQIFKNVLRREISDNNSLLSIEKDIFEYFQIKNKAFLKGMGLSLLKAFTMQLRVWLLIIFIGKVSLDFFSSLSILGFTYLSSMVPIPTALGSHEAIQYFAFKSLELPVSMSTDFTMIIRAAEIVISLLGLIFLIRAGFKLLGTKILKNDKNK
jgi:uncharacterized protein (TIRG00374 family)